MDKIEIFVGTYEEFLLGFKIEQHDVEENKYILKQSLASRDHSGSIRCVAAINNYVATGGADDRAVIYDIQKRSISHILINHLGTVNTLCFSPDGTHLFAGSDDGSISVTRIGTWVVEKVWKNAHKGSAVNHLSIHPSGKLALSIGNDLVLRTWNLIKGRQAYATNLKNKPSLGKVVENVEWGPDGKNFIVSGAKAVEIMSVDEAKVILCIECKSKPCSVCWINETDFLIGLESGDILYANLVNNDTLLNKFSDKRIKGISVFGDYLAIITSSGEVSLCKLIKGQTIEKICSTNIDCRPTCITIIQNMYEDDSDKNDIPKIKPEQDVKNKSVKTNIKPRVVVEIETDEIGSKPVADATSPPVKGVAKKKREKNKFDASIILEASSNDSNKRRKNESITEEKIEEIPKLKKSKFENNDSVEDTPQKKSKNKKKHNQSKTIELDISTEKKSKNKKHQSLTMEPEISTEKKSKKPKRKSVM